jgi:NhaA family Na+:H+ antiporter
MGLLAPVSARLAPEFVDAEELADVGSFESARTTMQMARSSVSTVEWLEHQLHPATSYVIVPLFALANAGITISTSALRHTLHSPITWGIVVGLVVGKPVGVMVTSRLAIWSGRADAPVHTDGRHLLGAGQAAGIGFTVALFIAELAFRNDDGTVNLADVTDAKMAILAASLVSGLLAYAVLRRRLPAQAQAQASG